MRCWWGGCRCCSARRGHGRVDLFTLAVRVGGGEVVVFAFCVELRGTTGGQGGTGAVQEMTVLSNAVGRGREGWWWQDIGRVDGGGARGGGGAVAVGFGRSGGGRWDGEVTDVDVVVCLWRGGRSAGKGLEGEGRDLRGLGRERPDLLAGVEIPFLNHVEEETTVSQVHSSVEEREKRTDDYSPIPATGVENVLALAQRQGRYSTLVPARQSMMRLSDRMPDREQIDGSVLRRCSS